MIDKAKNIVLQYVIEHLDKTDNVKIKMEDIYVVWFSKTLKNWKALVSTNLPDGMYYEVTYNGEKKETYLDAYKKFDNRRIPDEKYDKNKSIADEINNVVNGR